MNLFLRPAAPVDLDQAYNIHKAAMRPHVEPIWGWDETEQRRRFGAVFAHRPMQIIEQNSEAVGLLCVEDRLEELVLETIELLPESQGHGVGTDLIRDLLRQAGERRIPVTLQVFHNNPARRVYDRLGFRIYEETPTHVRMRWDPVTVAHK
ncbi:MAG: GNAT family N-acetyltransferase [Acidobacteria bacterium]|nr:GNAT family N-acetyltransferase [Acidobacteriota bacterium]